MRSEGAPTVRATFAAGLTGSGPLAEAGAHWWSRRSRPRPQLVRVGLYDCARNGAALQRRQLVEVELAGERTAVPVTFGHGEAVPDVVVTNDGDLGYARITFVERRRLADGQAGLRAAGRRPKCCSTGLVAHRRCRS